MFGFKRKHYNADVRELIPRFGFSIEDAGNVKVLNCLDIAWEQGYNKYEASLFVAWLTFAGMIQSGEPRHKEVYRSIQALSADWVEKGAVRSDLAQQFKDKIMSTVGDLIKKEDPK